MSATEIIFLVEQDPEGGYTAQALAESIFTEAEDLETLKVMVKDAVYCHFDTLAERPKIIIKMLQLPPMKSTFNSGERYHQS